jgi:putative transposase
MKVFKTLILPINTTKSNLDYLYQCNKETARVWNECIRLNTELWKSEKKYIDRKYLQEHIKGSFSSVLYSKCIQITIKKYNSAITGMLRANKQGRQDVGHPWKIKKYYNTMWDIACLKIDYDKNIIRVPRPRNYNTCNDKGKQKANPIYLKFKHLLPQNITQIELVYNDSLQLAINYYIEEENIQINSNNICAVDMGEIHSITTIDNNGNSEIITGRRIRSIQRFRNKELTELNKRLRKCKKGSRNYKKYRRAIRKLMSKSNNKMKDSINKTAKLFTSYILENNISTVVVGDLSKFNMNLKQEKKSKKQKTVQWNYGKILEQIKHTINKYGVKVDEISEAYTSQTCPICQNKYKPKNRNYICPKCGFTMHRDVVGAYNILSKYINNGEIKPLGIKVKPIKYLRIA